MREIKQVTQIGEPSSEDTGWLVLYGEERPLVVYYSPSIPGNRAEAINLLRAVEKWVYEGCRAEQQEHSLDFEPSRGSRAGDCLKCGLLKPFNVAAPALVEGKLFIPGPEWAGYKPRGLA